MPDNEMPMTWEEWYTATPAQIPVRDQRSFDHKELQAIRLLHIKLQDLPNVVAKKFSERHEYGCQACHLFVTRGFIVA